MKEDRYSSFAIFILLAGTLMGFTWNAGALAAGNWRELPPLALEDCIVVNKVLAPNPLSSAENDFWMVLKYEEKSPKADGTGAMVSGRSLNMYLVTGLAVLPEESVGLAYYQFLIVTFTDGGDSSGTIQQWLLSDADNDGKLDNARFERTTIDSHGAPLQTERVDIPVEEIQRFQNYFENANRELSSKAENGTANRCLVS